MDEHDRVTTLDALHELAEQKRAVACPKAWVFSRPRPAAFMLNLPGAMLLSLFRQGMYVYRKKEQ